MLERFYFQSPVREKSGNESRNVDRSRDVCESCRGTADIFPLDCNTDSMLLSEKHNLKYAKRSAREIQPERYCVFSLGVCSIDYLMAKRL